MQFQRGYCKPEELEEAEREGGEMFDSGDSGGIGEGQGGGGGGEYSLRFITDNRFENSLTTLCLFRFNQMQWWLMAGVEKWQGNLYFLFEFHRFFLLQILVGNPLDKMGHQRLRENKHTPLRWAVASRKILLLHSHRPQSSHYNSALLSFGFWLRLITTLVMAISLVILCRNPQNRSLFRRQANQVPADSTISLLFCW